MPGADIAGIQAAQAGLERNALAYVAAFFSVAFLALLAYHLRRMGKLYEQQTELLEKLFTSIATLGKYPDLLTPLIYELQQKRMARRGGTNPNIRLDELKKGGAG